MIVDINDVRIDKFIADNTDYSRNLILNLIKIVLDYLCLFCLFFDFKLSVKTGIYFGNYYCIGINCCFFIKKEPYDRNT